MRLEHHLVGGYVRYISPHIISIIIIIIRDATFPILIGNLILYFFPDFSFTKNTKFNKNFLQKIPHKK